MLRFPCARIEVTRARIGQHLVGGAVDQEQLPGTEGPHGLRPAGLAAKGGDADDRVTRRDAGRDDDRATERVPDQRDPSCPGASASRSRAARPPRSHPGRPGDGKPVE